ncbi:glucosaminidase domain-containing protein [Gammaproteobacteria bacterium]|nr:glucosaminidase domain-containing protein [Gammaproteobacteria bacterium]
MSNAKVISKFWTEFRSQLFFLLFVLGLFIIALQMKPATEKSVLATGAEVSAAITARLESTGRTQEVIPDFAGITNVQIKKQTFFDFLQSYIDAENTEILQHRTRLKNIHQKIISQAELGQHETAFLANISDEYKVTVVDELESVGQIQRLLRRVDVIPSSLVLSQSANETGWGTSRFAQHGKNFFGQWCFAEGCGMVPAQRSEDASYEVKRFRSVAESVHAYFMNLNTFPSYRPLRSIRQRLRQSDQEIDGISLAEGLHSYSIRGEEYVDELQSMIYYNGLLKRDVVLGRSSL